MGLEDDARTALAALEAQRGDELAIDVGHAVRAAIGASLPRTAAHESAAAQPDPSKTENLLAGEDDAPAVLVQADANGGWRDVGESYVHIYSGMTCPKGEVIIAMTGAGDAEAAPLPLKQISVFDEAGGDVACNYENPDYGVYLTFYASNWPDITLDDHFAAALRDIVDRFSITSETYAITAETKDDDEGEDAGPSSIEAETKAGAYILEPVDGRTFKTVLWLNKSGDWHVKGRATFVVEMERGQPAFSLTEILAAALYSDKLKDVDRHINSDVFTQANY